MLNNSVYLIPSLSYKKCYIYKIVCFKCASSYFYSGKTCQSLSVSAKSFNSSIKNGRKHCRKRYSSDTCVLITAHCVVDRKGKENKTSWLNSVSPLTFSLSKGATCSRYEQDTSRSDLTPALSGRLNSTQLVQILWWQSSRQQHKVSFPEPAIARNRKQPPPSALPLPSRPLAPQTVFVIPRHISDSVWAGDTVTVVTD